MTAQALDVIKYEEHEYPLFDYPLEPYWALVGKKYPYRERMTFCNRGYIAHWTIAEAGLYLERLAAYPPREIEIGIEEILNRQLPVMAEWFTGPLHLGTGHELAPTPYRRQFSEYLILDIAAGRLVHGA